MNHLLFISIITPLLQLFLNIHPTTSNIFQNDLIFNKLPGTWVRSNGRTYEKWEKMPDGSFFSAMYNVKGADTTLQEEVTTTKNGDLWVYAVKGADNADIVRFPSVEVTATKAHFSNPAHDFPTDIVYELIDLDSLRAYITGPNQTGKRDTIWFIYEKIQRSKTFLKKTTKKENT